MTQNVPNDEKASLLARLRTNRVWYNKSYSGYYHGIHLQGLAIADESRAPHGLRYGLVFQNHHTKDHFDWFWDTDDLKNKREQFLALAKTHPDQVETILKEGERNHARFVAASQNAYHAALVTLSHDDLKTTFYNLKNELVAVAQWSYSVDAFLSDGGEDWLEKLIKEHLGEKASADVIETLTLPTFPSFVNEAEILFLKICQALQKNDASLADRLATEYAERYFWIRTNYLIYAWIDKVTILEEARKWLREYAHESLEAKIREEETRTSRNINKKAAIFEELAVPSELRSIIRMTEVFTHLQDLRKERVLRMNALFYPFIQETSQRFAIEEPLGFYLTTDELFSLFDGQTPDWNTIKDRYEKGFLTIFYANGVTVFSSEEYKQAGWDKNFFEVLDEVKELKGTTAYRGMVRGIVRVLKNTDDIAHFQPGEILVANQTTPEYVPAMKIAAAMITDQGGITCHAAIVSRELQVPCVIGTKVATKVLKDGDIVEVDAEKGVVKIMY